jgi:hypothetical protein
MPDRFAPAPAYAGKVYVGLLADSGPEVEVYKGASALGRLRPRRDLWTGEACPERFAWGVGGDRDTLLALSILADALGADLGRVRNLCDRFRVQVLDRLSPARAWRLTYCQVALNIAAIEDEIYAGSNHHEI